MNQKVKQHRFLKYLRLLHTLKKLTESIIKARIRIRPKRSRSDQKGLDPNGSGSATLIKTNLRRNNVCVVVRKRIIFCKQGL
jgi:hypothetical protein